jgi:uncharacterized membrane protein YfhO
MLRIILGVIAGFIAWSIIWLGSDQVLISSSPAWYGNHQYAFQAAMNNQTPFTPDSTILLLHLLRAAIISIMAGFLAAVIARENRRSPLILGLLLLGFGVVVQVVAWNYAPLWYHVIFLAMLIPFTVLGGRIKRSTETRA